jgi:hypothetical protein
MHDEHLRCEPDRESDREQSDYKNRKRTNRPRRGASRIHEWASKKLDGFAGALLARSVVESKGLQQSGDVVSTIRMDQ